MNEDDAYKKLIEQSGKVHANETSEKPSRAGKKSLMSWHDPAVIRQVKQICFEHDMTQSDFVRECLNLGFAKYRKGQIA